MVANGWTFIYLFHKNGPNLVALKPAPYIPVLKRRGFTAHVDKSNLKDGINQDGSDGTGSPGKNIFFTQRKHALALFVP